MRSGGASGRSVSGKEHPVANREEFLQNADDNRILNLGGKITVYDSRDKHTTPRFGNMKIRWDGSVLVVTGVSGLTIRGGELSTAPGDNPVLRFENCQNIRIENLTAGGGGNAPVFEFMDCKDVRMTNTKLYESGYAIRAANSDITLTGCVLTQLGNPLMKAVVFAKNNSAIAFVSCTFRGNIARRLFSYEGGSKISVTRCDFFANDTGDSLDPDGGVRFDGGCAFEKNSFSF